MQPIKQEIRLAGLSFDQIIEALLENNEKTLYPWTVRGLESWMLHNMRSVGAFEAQRVVSVAYDFGDTLATIKIAPARYLVVHMMSDGYLDIQEITGLREALRGAAEVIAVDNGADDE